MDRQRRKARASWAGSGDAASEDVWFPLREKLGATEFLGYETETAEGVVAALVKDGKEVDRLKAGESGAIVLNQTPFYGESGGQVGDTGVMTGEACASASPTPRRRPAISSCIWHGGAGHAEAGHGAALEVDHAARARSGHHSARICCTRRCARCSAITSPSAARWSRRTGCASTSSHPKPITAEELEPRRGYRQRRGAGE
jgi:alanyl-tRNA synthetase